MEQQINDKEIIMAQLISLGYNIDKIESAYKLSQSKSLESVQQILVQGLEQTVHQQQQEQQKQQQQSISNMVNQQMSKELQDMGFSKIVAEKSLFLTQNKSIQSCLDYIENHNNDADFEEELYIIQQNNYSIKPQLTEEEKKQKLAELQQKARENRMKKEKEADQENEKNRIRYNRELQIAQQKANETQVKIQLELQRKQKMADEEYKQKLLRQMELERCEKLGIKPREYKNNSINQQEVKKLDYIQLNIDQINIAHPENLLPGMAKNCFNTLKLYLENISKNPNEAKFRKINSQNPRFQSQISNTVSGISILNNIGFIQDSNGFLILDDNFDLQLLNSALDLINKQI